MLIVGTGDGAYRVPSLGDGATPGVQKILDTPRVERVRQFDVVDGVFAATGSGLYAGTRPTHVYVAWLPDDGMPDTGGCNSFTHQSLLSEDIDPFHLDSQFEFSRTYSHQYESGVLDWQKLDGFQQLPGNTARRDSVQGQDSPSAVSCPEQRDLGRHGVSESRLAVKDDWGVPRHDNKAQLRDLCIHPDSPNRIVAGVEPAGVHVSPDGGETWQPRREGVHEDVHGLHVVDDGTYVAATGRGLYRTADAGHSWNRLDDTVDQRYFRTAYHHDGVLYASGVCVPPSERWETAEADPALFVCRDGTTLQCIEAPSPEEVIVGWTSVEGTLVGVTHRGKICDSDGPSVTVPLY